MSGASLLWFRLWALFQYSRLGNILSVQSLSLQTRPSSRRLGNGASPFASLDEVLAIHERVIEAFAGSTGVRDRGLLESALYRPQSGYYESLEEMAAAMFESLLIAHPFVDANKRVAFFATDVFLRLNGWKMYVGAKAAYAFVVKRLGSGTCGFDHLLPWIRKALVQV